MFSHENTVDFLIEQGVNPYTAAYPGGPSHLHLAVKNNVNAVEHILRVAPQLINSVDQNGNTAMHILVRFNPESKPGLSTALDTQENIQQLNGAKYNQDIMIKLLIRAGIDLTKKNNAGQTAADVAARPAIKKILNVLSVRLGDPQSRLQYLAHPDVNLSPWPMIKNIFSELFNFVLLIMVNIIYLVILAVISMGGILYKQHRDKKLAITQLHINRHENYIRNVLEKFFEMQLVTQSSVAITFRLILRPSEEIQRVLKELYTEDRILPVIDINTVQLKEALLKLLAEFYQQDLIKWQEEVLVIDIAAVLQRMPPIVRNTDFHRFIRTLIEASPEFRDRKAKDELITQYKNILTSVDTGHSNFLNDLQAYNSFLKRNKLSLDMLDNFTHSSARVVFQAQKIKSGMMEIVKIEQEYKNNKNTNENTYTANNTVPKIYSVTQINQSITALKMLDQYYRDLNKRLLKYYDKDFSDFVNDLIKRKILLPVETNPGEKPDSNKLITPAVDEEPEQNNVDEEESEEQESKTVITKNDVLHQQENKDGDSDEAEDEIIDEGALKPPPAPPSLQAPKPAGLQFIVNSRHSLFAPPPPTLLNEEPPVEEKARPSKAPQQAVAVSAKDLIKRIKSHALALSVLVAMVNDFNFEDEAEQILYRNALFYNLVRIFHGIWLLKLGSPDVDINLYEVKTMRHLLVYYSKDTGQDGLFDFAVQIRGKLFPQTNNKSEQDKQFREQLKDFTRTREEIRARLTKQFRGRIEELDITKTALYQELKPLRDEKKETEISESDYCLYIKRWFIQARLLIKVVNEAHVLWENPERCDALKGLLAVMGGDFLQVQASHSKFWEVLSMQFGDTYVDTLVRFRQCIYHDFTRPIDIDNRLLFKEAKFHLLSDDAAKIFDTLANDRPQPTGTQNRPG